MANEFSLYFYLFFYILQYSNYKDFNNADKSEDLWLLLLKIIMYHPDI